MSQCGSLAALDTADALVKRDADAGAAAAIAEHLRRARESYAKPLPLFRTLDEFQQGLSPRVRYAAADKSVALGVLATGNCHNGQKKLTLSLLEFVALAVKQLKVPPRDLCLVYAGASGMASVVAATVFPGLQLVLYDPDPKTVAIMPPFADKIVYRQPLAAGQAVDLSKRLVVFTGGAGWFDDAVARSIRAAVQAAKPRRRVLFVSDIRVDADEARIVQDMVDQQRWALLVQAEVYMFKFRIPYLWDRTTVAAYAAAAAGLAAATGCRVDPAPSPSPSPSPALAQQQQPQQQQQQQHVFPYLAGDMYIQLFGRPRTGEMRLIGAAKKKSAAASPTPTYALRSYDANAIEDKLAIFNPVYRSQVKFAFGNSAAFLREDAGFPTYEAVAEFAILSRCCRALGSGTSLVEETALHKRVDALLASFIAKDAWTCAFKTAVKGARTHPLTLEAADFLRKCAERVHAERPGKLPPDLMLQLRVVTAAAAASAASTHKYKHPRTF
jgi:hypothetical protein